MTQAGRVLDLTPMEFDLLVTLIARRGATHLTWTCPRRWGHSAAVVTRTVDPHIAEVRRKLERIREPADPHGQEIGYRWGAESH